MKKIIFYTAILAVAIVTTTSCRKEMPVLNHPENYYQEDFASVFESFWTGMNNNYIFWDIDPTDWDAIYEEYKPKFADLDINENEDIETAFEYFEEMTRDLVDGHYTLMVNGYYAQHLRVNGTSPSQNRHMQNRNYHSSASMQHFIMNNLPSRYLNNVNTGMTADGSLAVIQGFVNPEKVGGKKVCYFYFSRFAFTSYFMGELRDRYGYTRISEIMNNLAEIFADPELDGVVIDMRSNGGGSVWDLSVLWGSMLIGGDIHAGYQRKKSGEGRLDYGPRVPLTVRPFEDVQSEYADLTPRKNPNPVTAPIVVLADLNSVSCAEISTMMLSHLPNGYFVGETTWGGQGFLSNSALLLHNAGTFSNSFLSLVYTPFVINEAPNGKCYEGKGYSPSDAPAGHGFEVKYNEAQLAAGVDPQLEKAIEVISQK